MVNLRMYWIPILLTPKKTKPGVGPKAQEVKQGGKLQCGYKRYYLVSQETNRIGYLSVHMIPADVQNG